MARNAKQNQNYKLNVLFIASEAEPFIKVGGLGDVAGSLPLAIHKLKADLSNYPDVEIRLVIPFYEKIRSKLEAVHKIAAFNVDSINGPVLAEVYQSDLQGMTVYFISGEPVTRSSAVYGRDFKSDAEKFIFFSLACLHLPQILNWDLDILHVNDWHTAISAYYLTLLRSKSTQYRKVRSVLTLHNLPFMGTGSEEALVLYKIPPAKNKKLPSWGKQLPLPMGLSSADMIVAVSPTYAQEILTPNYGCDLYDFLKTRKSQITGILNGLDTLAWDPGTDKYIKKVFSPENLTAKYQNKLALQREFKLKESKEIPLLILISRMDPQKGVDIAIEGLKQLNDVRFQAILLGTGDPSLEEACRKLEKEMPEKIKVAITFDSELSHRMYAGADILLMPSRYEPCGLAQMIAMRYGCVPVARATGGLVDSIVDVNENGEGTGFLFSSADPESFSRTLLRALSIYKEKEIWKKVQRTGMVQDFSWANSAKKYVDLYASLMKPTSDKTGQG